MIRFQETNKQIMGGLIHCQCSS